jgi:hypothetical protein
MREHGVGVTSKVRSICSLDKNESKIKINKFQLAILCMGHHRRNHAVTKVYFY